jgi:hypothetical protein
VNYRILSLDGGGTWALIQLKALIALYGENVSGHDVLEDFDMVAANSGGSIVLGGLVENLTLAGILAFFENETKRKSIFSPTTAWGDRILHDVTGLGPKYSATNKLPALQHTLPEKGNISLDQVVTGMRRPGAKEDLHLLIIAFDYDRNHAKFFRSAPTSGPGWGVGETTDITLAEAIHASTNAPVNYFDAPAQFPDRAGRYWDGGITGCNNPVLAGVTEAIGKGQAASDIAALSIGTASVALPWPQPGEAGSPYVQAIIEQGLVTDLRKLATSILDDPPDIASFLAHVMTGCGHGVSAPADSRIVRMDPLVSPVRSPGGSWTAPGPMTAAQFAYLANLDMDAVEQTQVDAIGKYADLWLQSVAPNQPIRMNQDSLVPELGQAWFKDAQAAWNAIK